MSPSLSNPKRRWLQFSLRSMLIALTVAALALGWWKHRDYCLKQATHHEGMEMVFVLRGEIVSSRRTLAESSSDPLSSSQWKAEHTRCQTEALRHQELSRAFRQAVWRPWLRWSIVEPIEVDLEQSP